MSLGSSFWNLTTPVGDWDGVPTWTFRKWVDRRSLSLSLSSSQSHFLIHGYSGDGFELDSSDTLPYKTRLLELIQAPRVTLELAASEDILVLVQMVSCLPAG